MCVREREKFARGTSRTNSLHATIIRMLGVHTIMYASAERTSASVMHIQLSRVALVLFVHGRNNKSISTFRIHPSESCALSVASRHTA